MNDDKTPRDIGRDLVAMIISGYVKHKTVSVYDLPTVIASVHQAVSGLGKAPPLVEPPTPFAALLC